MAALTQQELQRLTTVLIAELDRLASAERGVAQAVAGSPTVIEMVWPDGEHALRCAPAHSWSALPEPGAALPGGGPDVNGWRITLTNADAGETLILILDGRVVEATVAAGGAGVTMKVGAPVPTTAVVPSQLSVEAAADRRLVVFEASPRNPDAGRFIAVDPANATGIPLPTASVVASLPAAGTIQGELVYESSSRRGYVWDGANWRNLQADAVLRFPTEAALLADKTSTTGQVAVAADTGTMFVLIKNVAGRPHWQRMGQLEVDEESELLSLGAGDGAICHVRNDDSVWERVGGRWICQGLRIVASVQEVFDWTLDPLGRYGDRALARDKGILYVRSANGWIPETPYGAPAVVLLQDLDWPLNGQRGIASDTGETFTWSGTAWSALTVGANFHIEADDAAVQALPTPAEGDVAISVRSASSYVFRAAAWIPGPRVRIYPSLAALQAENPPEGTVGWVPPAPLTPGTRPDFQGGLFQIRRGGNWVIYPWMTVPNAAALPGGVPDGTLALAQDPPRMYLMDSTATPTPGWQGVGGMRYVDDVNPDAHAVDGDVWCKTDTGGLKIRVGGVFQPFLPIGAIVMFGATAVPQNWLVCDGVAIPGRYAELIALVGANTPDLRGMFVKGGTPQAGFTRHPYSTALPRTAYTFDMNETGNHQHAIWTINGQSPPWKAGGYPAGVGDAAGAYCPGDSTRFPTGNHKHTVTIAGGDATTEPPHVQLLYIIKAA